MSALRAGIERDEGLCLQPSPTQSASCLCTSLFTPPHPHPHRQSPTHPYTLPPIHGLPKLPTLPSTYPLTPAPTNHASTHSPNPLLTHPLSLSPPTHMPTHSYNYLPGHSPPLPIHLSTQASTHPPKLTSGSRSSTRDSLALLGNHRHTTHNCRRSRAFS